MCYQNVESVLRTLFIFSDGGEHRQNQTGEDQQEPGHRIYKTVLHFPSSLFFWGISKPFSLINETSSNYLHIGMIDEGPSSGSLQNIVEEVLQPPVESIAFWGFLPSRDAAALPPGALLPS